MTHIRPRKGMSRRSPPIRNLRPWVERLEARCLLTAGTQSLATAYGQLPLSFETNQGQTDAEVRFLARGPGYGLFLTPTEAVLSLQPAPDAPGDAPARPADVLRMQLVGANPSPQVVGLDELPGTINYFLGNDPRSGAPTSPPTPRSRYQEVYPGIDLVYYGNQRQLEYDFVVAPGADPGAIRAGLRGRRAARARRRRATWCCTRRAATCVQQRAGRLPGGRTACGRRSPAATCCWGGGQVGFAVGAYDASRPLVIDPVLIYSTYLGGSGQRRRPWHRRGRGRQRLRHRRSPPRPTSRHAGCPRQPHNGGHRRRLRDQAERRRARRWSTPPTSAAAATTSATASPWTRRQRLRHRDDRLDQLPDRRAPSQPTNAGGVRRLRDQAERRRLGAGLLHLPRRQRLRRLAWASRWTAPATPTSPAAPPRPTSRRRQAPSQPAIGGGHRTPS